MTYPKCYCDKHVKIWAKAGLMHDSVRNIYPFEDSKQECKHVFANLDTKCKNQVSFLVEDVPLEAQVVQTTDGREFGSDYLTVENGYLQLWEKGSRQMRVNISLVESVLELQ